VVEGEPGSLRDRDDALELGMQRLQFFGLTTPPAEEPDDGTGEPSGQRAGRT